MRLTDWARAQGIHPKTAYRWLRAGTLPVPARQVSLRMILVELPGTVPESSPGGVALYARVSSHDQKDDLERRKDVWRCGRPAGVWT